jgi:hypothetical protein
MRRLALLGAFAVDVTIVTIQAANVGGRDVQALHSMLLIKATFRI